MGVCAFVRVGSRGAHKVDEVLKVVEYSEPRAPSQTPDMIGRDIYIYIYIHIYTYIHVMRENGGS
jgi:hypothetical protein